MRHEARFSVIFPAGSLSTAQVGDFEKTCHRYGLAVNLPLRNDGFGNIVASSGLSLQDAQMLRRQISSLGYNVDVINDNSDEQSIKAASSSPDTRVVGSDSFVDHHHDSISEMTSDAWMSLEMEPLDLGLSDGGQLSNSPTFTGEDWLKPDEPSQTLSVSAKDLLKVLNSLSSEQLETVSRDHEDEDEDDDDSAASRERDVEMVAQARDRAAKKAESEALERKRQASEQIEAQAKRDAEQSHAQSLESAAQLEQAASYGTVSSQANRQTKKPAFAAMLWIALIVVVICLVIVAIGLVSPNPIIDTLLMPIQ